MAVSKQQKTDILADLVSKFTHAQSIGFAATDTLTVEEFWSLRNSLREVHASYTIAKKTLIVKAMKDALNCEVDLAQLPGQIWVVCSNEDAVAGLGKVNTLVKETKGEKISWVASYMEGKMMNAEETQALASLPAKNVLLGQLVGVISAPLTKLAGTLDATVAGIVRVTKSAGDKAREAGKEKLADIAV